MKNNSTEKLITICCRVAEVNIKNIMMGSSIQTCADCKNDVYLSPATSKTAFDKRVAPNGTELLCIECLMMRTKKDGGDLAFLPMSEAQKDELRAKRESR